MRNGLTLPEIVLVLAIVGTASAVALPRGRHVLDWIAADRAARQVTVALAIARHAAVMQATRARLIITSDSLRIERSGERGWELWWRGPGPRELGVALEVSNPTVEFGPTGAGWGVSNTSVVLRRGSQVETITVSRVGRVKRW
ncbi:MAG: pilus assembly FimT family protein [Gemmatimonadales bacterium]